MKLVFYFSLITFTTIAWSAADWKVVAESTTKCKDRVQVLAKEGEKFVYIIDDNDKIKLLAQEDEVFTEQNAKSVTYSNTTMRSLDDKVKLYTFIQPSVVDGNPPKLDISLNGEADKCSMRLK